MLNALIVSHSEQDRKSLSRALKDSSIFALIRGVSSLQEAEEMVAKKKQFDVIFLSSDFPQLSISDLITNARHKHHCSDNSFVLLTKLANQTPKALAENMAMGIQGFLCEPYTKKAIQELADLTDKLRQANTNLKLTAATGLMLTSMLPNDFEAGENTNSSIVEKVNKALQHAKQESGSKYVKHVFSSLKELTPAKEEHSAYKGPSARVKRLLAEKAKTAKE